MSTVKQILVVDDILAHRVAQNRAGSGHTNDGTGSVKG